MKANWNKIGNNFLRKRVLNLPFMKTKHHYMTTKHQWIQITPL